LLPEESTESSERNSGAPRTSMSSKGPFCEAGDPRREVVVRLWPFKDPALLRWLPRGHGNLSHSDHHRQTEDGGLVRLQAVPEAPVLRRDPRASLRRGLAWKGRKRAGSRIVSLFRTRLLGDALDASLYRSLLAAAGEPIILQHAIWKKRTPVQRCPNRRSPAR
jgi:hypothetical protein